MKSPKKNISTILYQFKTIKTIKYLEEIYNEKIRKKEKATRNIVRIFLSRAEASAFNLPTSQNTSKKLKHDS